MRNTAEMAGGDINTMLCPIRFNSNTIELTVHTACYCVLDLLCVMRMFKWVVFKLLPGKIIYNEQGMVPHTQLSANCELGYFSAVSRKLV